MTPFATIESLAEEIRRGLTTSEMLVERCLAGIERHEGDLNAFITVCADTARARARRADQEIRNGQDRGALHGIPLSVKDLVDIDGLPTTAASAVRDGHRATSDAPVIARLRRAGAIFIGKCNLHEFAFGTTGEDSAFGPTRNPHAGGHMAGGSSSGSAVSVAAGMAVASVGTDTGGSIRIPAAACGVVGLKPSFGEVSCDGVVPLARTLDHVGPLGATVRDVAAVYDAMVAPLPSATRVGWDTPEPPDVVRVGVPRDYFLDALDDTVRSDFDALLTRLRAKSCDVQDVTLPHAHEIADIYRQTVLFEAFAVHRPTLEEHPDAYSPRVRERIEMGAAISEREYQEAQARRDTLRRDVDNALHHCHCLVLPTLPMPAPRLGTTAIDLAGVRYDIRQLTLRLTQLFDLTGHPAISVPMGLSTTGLPTAVQLIGSIGDTPSLLRVAARYEATLRGNT